METKDEELIKFGVRLKELRKEFKLSQEQLADRANLHRTYIGMIERAEKNITLLNIVKLAKSFDLTISELLKGV